MPAGAAVATWPNDFYMSSCKEASLKNNHLGMIFIYGRCFFSFFRSKNMGV